MKLEVLLKDQGFVVIAEDPNIDSYLKGVNARPLFIDGGFEYYIREKTIYRRKLEDGKD